jgi:hypothetical protein
VRRDAERGDGGASGSGGMAVLALLCFWAKRAIATSCVGKKQGTNCKISLFQKKKL